MMTDDYLNLLQPIVQHAGAHPDQLSLILLTEAGEEIPITAQQLHNRACSWATVLENLHIQPNDFILIILEHSPNLIYSFLGALYLQAIPSIFPAPSGKMDAAYYAQQIRLLIQQTTIRAVITTSALADALQPILENLDCELLDVEQVQTSGGSAGTFTPNWQQIPHDQTAFLQFSSGTTGAKKGILISQRAILNQIRTYKKGYLLDGENKIVSWLPLHHDMGLITGLLLPLTIGIPTILISPTHWIRDPKTLLWAVHRHRGTHSWMPNFAFNHLVRTIRSQDIEGVNLSSWLQIANGAEPIRWETIQAFIRKYLPYGLRPEAITTGYGMAENTLTITRKPYDEPIVPDWISRKKLQEEGKAENVPAQSEGSIPMITVGVPVSSTKLIIADEQGNSLPERTVGEILIQGDTLFQGYYQQPELTAKAFHGAWFRTGDLGYFVNNHLYITGRKKDLIIVGGKNIYPEDIEELASQIPNIRPGRVVAFGIFDPRIATEKIVLVCETMKPLTPEEKQTIADQLRQQIARHAEVTLADIQLTDSRWIVKSSSGKTARHACKEKYLVGR